MNHSILFEKLLQRNLSPVIISALLNWHSDQNVSWNSQLSDDFSVSNGYVRVELFLQSYLQFTSIIYCLSWRKKCRLLLEQSFVGVVSYADDIALLVPSPTALRLMLDMCSSFASTHHLLSF